MPYYLATSTDPAEAGLNEIKTWLGSFITRPDFLINPPPKLSDLRAGLKCGVQEIILRLDAELEAEIHRAGEPQHSIETDQDDFFEAREYVFEDIQGDQPLYLNRADATKWLELVREEIRWMNNEIRRLECHMKIAFELKMNRCRNSFVYYPTKRQDPPFSEVPFVKEDEEEDDQVMMDAGGEDRMMLEVGEAPEWVKKEIERSSTPDKKIKVQVEDARLLLDDEMEDGELEPSEELDEKDATFTKQDSLSPDPEVEAQQSEEENQQPNSQAQPSGWGMLSLFRS